MISGLLKRLPRSSAGATSPGVFLRRAATAGKGTVDKKLRREYFMGWAQPPELDKGILQRTFRSKNKADAGHASALETPQLLEEFPGSTREADAPLKVLKTRVRAERIEAGPQQDTRVKSLFVAFFEPHGFIRISERYIDHGNLRSIRMTRV